MPTPDAHPVGETADGLLGQIRAQVCCCEDAAECGPLEQISAARAEMDRLLAAYRDTCKAEARAALLADAPVVWIGRDDEGAVVALDPASGTHEVLPDPFDALSWAMLTPGTVRRYALVPIEGEETTDG